MSKRRGFILLLFLSIGVYAVSRTLLLIRSVLEEEKGNHIPRGEGVRKRWNRLLRRPELLVMTVPFLITALLLFLHTLQSE